MLHIQYSSNWKNGVHREDLQTCYCNKPSKINVFFLHQPFCEHGIKAIANNTPFRNFPTINEILLVSNCKILDGLQLDILCLSIKLRPPIRAIYLVFRLSLGLPTFFCQWPTLPVNNMGPSSHIIVRIVCHGLLFNLLKSHCPQSFSIAPHNRCTRRTCKPFENVYNLRNLAHHGTM
jgi:hypothetical protein